MLFRAQLTHQALLLLNPPTHPSSTSILLLQNNTLYVSRKVRLNNQRIDMICDHINIDIGSANGLSFAS